MEYVKQNLQLEADGSTHHFISPAELLAQDIHVIVTRLYPGECIMSKNLYHLAVWPMTPVYIIFFYYF